MITLIIILNDTLPIGIEFHLPIMIKRELTREIEILHAGLFVDFIIFLFPFHICFPSLEINPDETCFVDVDMDGEEGVLSFIEIGNCLGVKARCF